MNNIDEQIRNRLSHDNDTFSDAFVSLSEVVTKGELLHLFSDSRKESSDEAISEILSFYGIKDDFNVPETITDPEEYLDYILNPVGVMRRTVTLSGDWYKTSFGAYLAVLDNDKSVALLPTRRGYRCINPIAGESFFINKDNVKRIYPTAISFYLPLPEKKLSIKDIIFHIFSFVTLHDVIKICIFTFAITGVSLLMPYITRFMFDNVALQSKITPLVAIFIFMISIYTSMTILTIGKDMVTNNISLKADAGLYNAIMMRILNLPANFFRKFNAGNLHSKVENSQEIASSIIDFILGTGITTLMSFLYVWQIKTFSTILVVPSIVIIICLAIYIIVYSIVRVKYSKKVSAATSDETGILVSILNGIQKIRLSGSEKRVFAKWADIYKERASSQHGLPVVLLQYTTITTILSIVGDIILFFFALKSGISAATYIAFTASYGMLSGAFLSLASSVSVVSGIKAMLDELKPVLEEIPESAISKRTVKHLSGKIDIMNVSFKYLDSQPLIIDNLSLSIKPGEYLGIVGKSGCGKSTLMRLMLGFEKATRGIISFDSIDISSLEPKSLRRQIGCVMQDGGLFTDTIKANITISAPFATDKEVWEACKSAGIDKDIKDMPMGLETLVSDSTGTISGGQKQRILIARALISKPNILFFDEATSALDNNTQRIVTNTLKSLDCTRIVIAHRLSTVKDCDRIVLVESGKIVEEGNYDELMSLKGKFAKLVKRQIK